MARKKKTEDHDNHERWLISYADFITLLFALFVVMYAISSVNEGKYRIFSDSLSNAFSSVAKSPNPVSIGQSPRQPIAKPLGSRKNAAQHRRQEKMQAIARDILKVLAPLVSGGQVRVTQSSRGIMVEINASVLFAPGQAALQDNSAKALREVALVLKDEDHMIEVEGHTDPTPISTSVFPSNWELSTARASSVVRLLIDSGVAAGRLSAVGYGPNRPVESNDTAEGRARNRRVTVTILSAVPEKITEIPVEVPPVQ
ncbi:MAG: flagellar motor protein MotD [Sulfuricella sp.]|nr:flagellar motor protein MotD [Sulfuricella sp.]